MCEDFDLHLLSEWLPLIHRYDPSEFRWGSLFNRRKQEIFFLCTPGVKLRPFYFLTQVSLCLFIDHYICRRKKKTHYEIIGPPYSLPSNRTKLS